VTVSGDDAIQSWHALEVEEICTRLDADRTKGLDAERVRKKSERFGENALPRARPPSLVLRLLAQLADPLVLALIVAAGVAAFLAATSDSDAPLVVRYGDSGAILIIVLLNAGLGLFQERKAAASLLALERMAAPTARVIRGGKRTDIDASLLVPGDLVMLEAGDAVSADMRLLEAHDLATVEAALTGESSLVTKLAPDPVDADTSLADRVDMVYFGTSVARGSARALVVETGPRTQVGRIGALLAGTKPPPTPIERRMLVLGRQILVVCVASSALLFALGMLRGSESIAVLLLTAVSLAVAAIPEGLPAITTISLGLGTLRMARRGAIVRHLPAVEALGAITTLCTDKTGTLTSGAMVVRSVLVEGQRFDVTGDGLAVEGEVVPPTNGALPEETLRELALAAVICNDAALEEPETEGDATSVVGDPTEGALLVLGRKLGLTHEGVMASRTRVRVLPFSGQRKRMSVIVRGDDAVERVWAKGSPEEILKRSSTRLVAGELMPFDEAARDEERVRVEAEAALGRRVLCLARGDGGGEDPEREFVYLGAACMDDPPRRGVKESVRECQCAGVHVAMVTGDHPHTAARVAKELGIEASDAEVLEGREFEQLSDEELDARVKSVSVFARMSAEQKLRLVESLERCGEVVAMTGDGVNDAPALRRASIGVAMGKSGTDVAREAGDMVLADDDFTTIVRAIREGRGIFDALGKFIFFLGSSNAGLVIAVLAVSILGGMPELLPIQLLWINLITNGLPALALGVDPAASDLMLSPPRSPSQGILGRRELLGMLFVGMVMAGAALLLTASPSLMPWLLPADADAATASAMARTMAYATLGASPLVHAFSCRSRRQSVWASRPPNRWLWLAVFIGALLLGLTFLPGTRLLFHTTALTLRAWGMVAALSILPLPAVELAKWIERRMDHARASRPASPDSSSPGSAQADGTADAGPA